MATFRENQCHHRDAEGRPDCRKSKLRPSVNLCKEHEAEYRAGKYRARRDTGYGGSALKVRAAAPPRRAPVARRKVSRARTAANGRRSRRTSKETAPA